MMDMAEKVDIAVRRQKGKDAAQLNIWIMRQYRKFISGM
jgi:hypothetical protein